MTEWQWGDAHRARLSHPLFGHIPLLKSLSDRSFIADGGAETINRANFAGGSASLPWQDRLADVHGPSLRMTIDLSNHHQAETMLAGGQSGHPFSPHYDDLLDLWQADQGVTISQSPAEETLFLEPER
jgi:penicillin amidase